MNAAADALRSAFVAALGTLDLAGRTFDALPERPPSGRRVTLIALGKSAATMASGAARRWGSFVGRAVLARPARAREFDADTLAALAHARVECFATGHPLPDSQSVDAGRAAISAAEHAARAGHLVLVLLSGGASAAACVPGPGLTLEAVREQWRQLLASGADIATVNAARARTDRIKRGGLSRAAGAADVLTLAAADVLAAGDALREALGSGPTFEEDSAPGHGARDYRVIAGPGDARDAVAAELVRRGFSPVGSLPDARDDVDALAREYALALRALAPGAARVAVGEPTVRLPDVPGRGGRAGRLALGVAREIRGLAGAVFLAAATDGVDGESGHAGAVVDEASWDAIGESSAISALDRFDDAAAHEALGSSVDVGLTGINLLDVHVLARAPSS